MPTTNTLHVFPLSRTRTDAHCVIVPYNNHIIQSISTFIHPKKVRKYLIFYVTPPVHFVEGSGIVVMVKSE
jgi:hypothetical protein